MELNEIRPFFSQAMRTLARLRLTDVDAVDVGAEEDGIGSSAGIFA